MELPNIGSAMSGIGAVNHPPVNPSAPIERRPPFPETQDPAAKGRVPAEKAPHAAPSEKIVIHSQQAVAEALRELKLPETPQNLLIAETLRQFDQGVSAQNMSLVTAALRGLAAHSADDVAAVVILMMHNLPVTKESVAALRQLMTGAPLPAQLTKLEGQLQQLLGQLNQAGAQLANLPSQPGANPALQPGQIAAQLAQAQAALGMAAGLHVGAKPGLHVTAAPGGSATSSDSGSVEGEGGETPAGGEKTKGASGAAAMGGMASTGRRGEQGPIKRALGGAIGSLGDQATGSGEPTAEQASENQPATARPQGETPRQAGVLRLNRPHDQQGQDQQGQGQQQGRPAQLDNSRQAPSGRQAPSPTANRPTAPAQAVPPGGAPSTGSPTTPPAASANRPPTSAEAGPSATASGQAQGQTTAGARQAPQGTGSAAASNAATQPAPGSGMDVPPDLPPLGPRLDAAIKLLKGLNLATTVQESSHLGAQVQALKDLYGPLQDTLLRVGADLHRYLRALGPIDTSAPERALLLLAKLAGRSVPPEGLPVAQQQELLQLLADIQESLRQTGGALKEAVQHLQAREQLSQANQVFCLPLALPGPPERSVELLIEPDADSRHRQEGGGPLNIRLAVETHHMGPVGIELTHWQQQLSIQLDVQDSRVQAKMAFAQEKLEKALARLGYTTATVRIQVAQRPPQNSLLLPERTYARSLRRIEGVV